MRKKIKRSKSTQGTWVLVKDRLPTQSKKYLVQFEDGYIFTDLFFVNDNNFCANRVIAWAEIPEPPIKTKNTMV